MSVRRLLVVDFPPPVSVILLILLAVSPRSTRLLPPESTTMEEHLSDCIANISAVYLRRDLPLLIQTPETWYVRLQGMAEFSKKRKHGDKILEALQKRGIVPLAVAGVKESLQVDDTNLVRTLLENNCHKAIYPGSYLVMLIGIRKNIINMAFLMIKRMSAGTNNKRAPLMIVTDNLPLRIVGKLLSISFNFGYTVTIILNHHVNDVIYVYGWLPKDQKNLCDSYVVEPRLLDKWICKERKFKENNNLFPPKQLKDIKNCRLNVIVNKILTGVALHTSFLLNLFRKDVLYRVYLGDAPIKSHIVLPLPYSSPRYLHACGATYPHVREEITWYVPAGTTLPRWLSIFKAFSPAMWILAAFTFTMGTVVLYVVGTDVDRSFTKSAMNALLSHLVMGSEEKFKGAIATTFFTFWLFYCLHINTAYQAALFGYLVNPGEVPPIQTLEELKSSGLKMYTTIDLSGSVENKYNDLIMSDEKDDIGTKRDEALLGIVSGMTTYIKHELIQKGKPLIKPISENTDTIYFGVYIQSSLRCILHDHIENLISRYVEAGHFERHETILNRILLKGETVTTSEAFSFSLLYLEGAFYVLLFGLLGTVIVFLAEILCHKTLKVLARK